LYFIKPFPLPIFRIFVNSLIVLSTFFVAHQAYSQIEFIENKGQWDSQVKFMSRAGDGAFFLQNEGYTVVQHDPADLTKMLGSMHNHRDEESNKSQQNFVHSNAYKVKFLNSTSSPEIIPDKPVQSVNNYFIGNDKNKWASGCRIYQGVTYKNVYPNIDVRYYSDAAGRLKYDLIVHPGGNVDNIALQYKGIKNLSVTNKELHIKTAVGENKELYPYTYQVIDNQRREHATRYEIKGDVVKFKVKNYDRTTTLTIDPVEIFFTYSGSAADNYGFTATYGPDGSFFSAGIAFGTGYPVSTGAFQTLFNNGERHIAIIKLTPDGVNRVYATYLGGNDKEQPHSLIVDPQGNLIMAGRSSSQNYPTTVPVFGTGGQWDIVVTKLNATGSALIGSMRIGGSNDDGVNIKELDGTQSLKRNYGDDARSEVIIDNSGNIYVASCTKGDFKTTAGVFQPSPGGQQDGVVIKLNSSCNSVLWSSYLGGSGDDAAYVLALGNNNNIYVAGGTGSRDLTEISPAGVISSTYNGGASDPCDGFVVELNNNGTAAVKGTYLGTGKADQIYGVQTDKSGNVYVMGTTEGSWLHFNAIFENLNSKQFISKLKPDLSEYIYSTTFGSGSALPNISPTAFLVDRCENVYVSGWGGKSNSITGFGTGTTKGMPVTPDAIKPNTDASGSDFYFFVLQKDAVSILYGTFFGQEDPPKGGSPKTFGDHVDGGTSRFDKNGVIYQAICANCYRTVNFIGTPGTWSPTNPASQLSNCNLGMLKIEMNFAGVQASPQASINGVVNDTVGCIPLTVDFTDLLQKGKSYVWDFGDGAPKQTITTFNIQHTYLAVGTYKVSLVAIDSTTCNIADTAYLTIKAGNNKANLDFIPNKLSPCTNLTYSFNNTSSATGSFGPNSFTWDFGDGSPVSAPQGKNPPVTHTYAGPGTYLVKLILQDTSFCNSPEDTIKTVRLSPQITAKFSTPAAGCVPYNAEFTNTSLGGLSFFWDFGDGSTSTDENPKHLYNNVGKYTVKLYAFDSTSCNKIDSSSINLSVNSIPVAGFTFAPVPSLENKATRFTNESTGATNYLWNFGDGDTSVEVNPSHLYNATGTFNVCLTAINEAGCSDSICLPVQAIINPLLAVPNAFTPTQQGSNSIIKVEGFGIKQMQWNIYNRWGQKVFEGTSIKRGWDGTFKGKLQPMDVYTYTLDIIFYDGKKLRRAGDITLLR
jgi:gliding motility-associated-like protein